MSSPMSAFRAPHEGSPGDHQQPPMVDRDPTEPSVVDGMSVVVWDEDAYVYGGPAADRIWRFTLTTAQWTEIVTIGEVPGPRLHHTACAYANALIVTGGEVMSEVDTPGTVAPSGQALLHHYELDLTTFEWMFIDGIGAVPEYRSHHSAVVSGDTMVVVGGKPADGSPLTAASLDEAKRTGFYDIFVLEIPSRTWKRIEMYDPRNPMIWGQSGVVFRDTHVLFFGGFDVSGVTTSNGRTLHAPPEAELIDTVHILDLQRMQWSRCQSSKEIAAPVPRALHASIIYQNHMVIFGGFTIDAAGRCINVNDCWVWNVSTGEWRRLEFGIPQWRSRRLLSCEFDGQFVVMPDLQNVQFLDLEDGGFRMGWQGLLCTLAKEPLIGSKAGKAPSPRLRIGYQSPRSPLMVQASMQRAAASRIESVIAATNARRDQRDGGDPFQREIEPEETNLDDRALRRLHLEASGQLPGRNLHLYEDTEVGRGLTGSPGGTFHHPTGKKITSQSPPPLDGAPPTRHSQRLQARQRARDRERESTQQNVTEAPSSKTANAPMPAEAVLGRQRSEESMEVSERTGEAAGDGSRSEAPPPPIGSSAAADSTSIAARRPSEGTTAVALDDVGSDQPEVDGLKTELKRLRRELDVSRRLQMERLTAAGYPAPPVHELGSESAPSQTGMATEGTNQATPIGTAPLPPPEGYPPMPDRAVGRKRGTPTGTPHQLVHPAPAAYADPNFSPQRTVQGTPPSPYAQAPPPTPYRGGAPGAGPLSPGPTMAQDRYLHPHSPQMQHYAYPPQQQQQPGSPYRQQQPQGGGYATGAASGQFDDDDDSVIMPNHPRAVARMQKWADKQKKQMAALEVQRQGISSSAGSARLPSRPQSAASHRSSAAASAHHAPMRGGSASEFSAPSSPKEPQRPGSVSNASIVLPAGLGASQSSVNAKSHTRTPSDRPPTSPRPSNASSPKAAANRRPSQPAKDRPAFQVNDAEYEPPVPIQVPKPKKPESPEQPLKPPTGVPVKTESDDPEGTRAQRLALIEERLEALQREGGHENAALIAEMRQLLEQTLAEDAAATQATEAEAPATTQDAKADREESPLASSAATEAPVALEPSGTTVLTRTPPANSGSLQPPTEINIPKPADLEVTTEAQERQGPSRNALNAAIVAARKAREDSPPMPPRALGASSSVDDASASVPAATAAAAAASQNVEATGAGHTPLKSYWEKLDTAIQGIQQN